MNKYYRRIVKWLSGNDRLGDVVARYVWDRACVIAYREIQIKLMLENKLDDARRFQVLIERIKRRQHRLYPFVKRYI